jgi:hypothetical protein
MIDPAGRGAGKAVLGGIAIAAAGSIRATASGRVRRMNMISTPLARVAAPP